MGIGLRIGVEEQVFIKDEQMAACRISGLWAVFALAAAGCSLNVQGAGPDPMILAAQEAEAKLQARVGLAVLDTADGREWHYRADERFPMASTSKVLICAALLARGDEALNTAWLVQAEDIQSYAPSTQDLIGQKIPAEQLCAITLRNSDNTAANGVLELLGGPGAVTSFLRTIGDSVTRLDRNEPTLNEAKSGDPRDTTTPQAMVQTLQSLVLGRALERPAQERLTAWLRNNEVGGPLLRAGLPADWQIADRTGSGGFGTRAAVAVMWPPERSPLIAAVYVTQTEAPIEERNAAIALIAKAIAQSTQHKLEP